MFTSDTDIDTMFKLKNQVREQSILDEVYDDPKFQELCKQAAYAEKEVKIYQAKGARANAMGQAYAPLLQQAIVAGDKDLMSLIIQEYKDDVLKAAV